MSKDIFPQLQALLHKVDDALDAVKPVITFSGLPDNHTKFWKVNYPKGSGAAKSTFMALCVDHFMKSQDVFIASDGYVKPLNPANNEKKG